MAIKTNYKKGYANTVPTSSKALKHCVLGLFYDFRVQHGGH